MEMQREQLALDEVGLDRLAQPDGDVGLAHREIELFLGGDQRDADLRIEIEKLAEPRRQPMHADAGRRGHPQLAVRPFAAVGQLGARGFELHEHFMRGSAQQLALLGEDQPARMAMEQRHAELRLERRNLARHRRLRQAELLAGMREAAGLGGGMENPELVPIHDSNFLLLHEGADEIIRPRRAAAPRRVRRGIARFPAPPCSPGRRR